MDQSDQNQNNTAAVGGQSDSANGQPPVSGGADSIQSSGNAPVPVNSQTPANSDGSAPISTAPAATGTLNVGKDGAHHFVIPAHPNTSFDEDYFLKLLEGSISLTLEEKNKVIEAIPRLNIEQIDELIKIFEEEKQKFSELESEYADDVAKLKQQRENEFKLAEIKQEELSESESEAAEAEALKRKLMGGE